VTADQRRVIKPARGNCGQGLAVNSAIRRAISLGFVLCVAAGNSDRDAGSPFVDFMKQIPAVEIDA